MQGSASAADADTVTVRDLRNDASAVLRRVEAGEPLTVAVGRRPVARLVPFPRRRTEVPSREVLAALDAFQADPGLPADLCRAVPDTTDDP